jgi:hypothetical protein
MTRLGVARRLGFGLSRELWLVEAGIFLNMLGYGRLARRAAAGPGFEPTGLS